MSAESKGLDPYETVLADLKAKRGQLDTAIAAIEAVRSGVATATPPAAPAEAPDNVDGPGAYLGMSIVDATKKLLSIRRKAMRNPDIWAALKAGGLVLNSGDPVNTVGAVLTRRANEVGDLVKVDRGTWGLKEWYPNRSFKKKGAEEDVVKTVADTIESVMG